MIGLAPQPFSDRVDRCPSCKVGLVLECDFGWWCSRRYDPDNPCGWEKGDPGPSAAPETKTTEHDEHLRKYRRRRALRHREMLKPRRCDACKQPICCFFGQRSVEDLLAPGGVWILHPSCSPPIGPA